MKKIQKYKDMLSLDLTEDQVLEILRSKKIPAEIKLDIGLNYMDKCLKNGDIEKYYRRYYEYHPEEIDIELARIAAYSQKTIKTWLDNSKKH